MWQLESECIGGFSPLPLELARAAAPCDAVVSIAAMKPVSAGHLLCACTQTSTCAPTTGWGPTAMRPLSR